MRQFRHILLGCLILLLTGPALAGTAPILVAAQHVALDGTSQNTAVVNLMKGVTDSATKPAAKTKKLDQAIISAAAMPTSAPPGPFPSEQAAIAWVKQELGDNGGMLPMNVVTALGALEAAAVKEGARQIVLAFIQKVQILNANGNPEERSIGINWFKVVNGSVHSDGYIASPSSLLGMLYIKYDQKRIADQLPSQWQLPGGGWITWQKFVLDLANPNNGWAPQGPSQSVDTGGAFDEPSTATPANIDAGLNKIAAQWAPPKMAAAHVSLAFIDYGRKLEPVYDTLPDGSLVARIAVNVTKRKAVYGCDGSKIQYTNEGVYGAELKDSRDFYLLSGGVLSPLGHHESSRVSPSQSYAWTVDYATGTSSLVGMASLMAKKVINPFAKTLAQAVVYDYDNDTVNGLTPNRYVQLAPISMQGIANNTDPDKYAGNVPGIGFVCADTVSGDLWINGQKQSWYSFSCGQASTGGFLSWSYTQCNSAPAAGRDIAANAPIQFRSGVWGGKEPTGVYQVVRVKRRWPLPVEQWAGNTQLQHVQTQSCQTSPLFGQTCSTSWVWVPVYKNPRWAFVFNAGIAKVTGWAAPPCPQGATACPVDYYATATLNSYDIQPVGWAPDVTNLYPAWSVTGSSGQSLPHHVTSTSWCGGAGCRRYLSKATLTQWRQLGGKYLINYLVP